VTAFEFRELLTGGNMRRVSLNTLCAFLGISMPESVSESLTPLCMSALAYRHRSSGNTLNYCGREGSKKTYRHPFFRNNRFDMSKEFLLLILIKRQQCKCVRKGMGSGLFKRKRISTVSWTDTNKKHTS